MSEFSFTQGLEFDVKQKPKEAIANASSNKVLDSDDLFGDMRHIVIRHAGACYLLQRTKQDKLLLTKQN